MSSPVDFADWTQPVASVDQVGVVIDQPNLSPAGTAKLDVTAYNELLVSITPPSSAAGAAYMLDVVWWDATGTIVLDENTLTFNSDTSYLAGVTMTWRIPVQGSLVQFDLVRSDASTVGIFVTGGRRISLTRPIRSRISTQDDRLLYQNANPIPAGGSIGPFWIPPVTQQISVVWSYVIASGSLDVVGYFKTGVTVSAVRIARVTVAGLLSGQLLFQVPGIGCQITLNNADAGAHSGSLQVWDVS